MPYLVGYVTPQDFGALGNNTNDDTTAVQNAVNAVSVAGGTLFIPMGTYKLSGVITVPANVSLLGAGPGATILNQTSTSANAVTYNPGTALSYLSVSNLALQGPSSGTGIGLLVEGNSGAANVNSMSFNGLLIYNFGSHGMELINGVGCELATVNINNVGGHGIFLSGGTGNVLSNCVVIGGATTQQGIQLTTVSYTVVNGCRVTATGGGYQVTGGSANQIVGCGADTILAANGQDGSGFKINGGTVHTVTSCFSTVNRAKAFYVTNSAVASTLNGIQETAPGAGATASIQVDSGSTAVVVESSTVTATSYATATSLLATGGAINVPRNVTVGGSAALGDNGVGELQLTNATTVPTTNPTGGGVVYARNGGILTRDVNGGVFSMVDSPGLTGSTTNAIAETVSRTVVTTSAAPATGQLFIQSVWLPAGISVGHIGFATGTTAASGPTHWWTALLDNTYKQQAHSNDQTTGAIAASTWFNLAMATPFVTTYSGTYYLALLIATSTTQPTILQAANTPAVQFWTGASAPTPVPNGASTAALTTPGTDGTTTYAAPSAASAPFYLYCSA